MTDVSNTIESISLHFQNLGVPLLVILLAIAVGSAVLYYRTSRPESKGPVRLLLITLRAAALAVLLVGLAEPVLDVVRSFTRRERVAVLVDNSSSMAELAAPMVSDALDKARATLGDAGHFRGFDATLHDLAGKTSFNGSATDITGAIRGALRGRDTAAVVLISDGRWNLGEDPAGSTLPRGVPVHTVLAASGAPVGDVVLRSVSSAAIGHEGDTLSVELEIGAQGRAGGEIPIEITENGDRVAGTTVRVTTGESARIRVPLPLGTPGTHHYSANIMPEGDSRSENNTRAFDVAVLKSAFRILLSAPRPSPDLAFLRRALEEDDSFTIITDLVVLKGVSSDPISFDEPYDAFIVVDGGGSGVHAATDTVAENIRGGAGLWLIGSDAPLALQPITGALAFTDSVATPDGGVLLNLTDIGRGHFITAGILDDIAESSWASLPPLASILAIPTPGNGTRVLARTLPTVADGPTLPAIITSIMGDGKILMTPVSGLWRWRLRMAGAGRSDTAYGAFVRGSVRWLTTRTDTDPLQVATTAGTYLSGDEIAFEGRLFDNVFTPLSGAEIQVTVDNDPAYRLFLDEIESGRYTGALRGISPGDHAFDAVAWLDDRRIAESGGTFDVADFSLELLDLSPDPAIMRAIAERTGGMSVTLGGIDSLLSSIEPSFATERRDSRHYPYLDPMFPLLAIIFFVAEWAIRKHHGMI